MWSCLNALRLSILLTLLVGCQSFQKHSAQKLWEPSSWKQTTGPELVELSLSNLSPKEVSLYQAKLLQKDYKLEDLVREKQSVVDFKVRTKKLKKTQKGLLVWEIETLKKNGVFPLNAMAFPELGEKIPFTISPSGEIIQAGSFHEDSIFYSPIVVLPKHKVKVGETWAGSFEWRDSDDSPVYQMQVVSTHKGFVKCGSATCVDIDVSGSVEILGLDKEKNDFRSLMKGRIYFDPIGGSIVYSHMNSEDEFISETHRTHSTSCLSSVIESPKYIKSPDVTCHIIESM